MNKTAAVAVFVLGLGLACLAAPGIRGLAAEPVDGKQVAALSEKLKALMKERLEAALEEQKARKAEFDAGRSTLDTFLDSAQRVLKAQLELSDKKEDQLAAWESYLQLTKEVETVCKALYEAGRRSITEYMVAKYNRLDAEIGLERAKGK